MATINVFRDSPFWLPQVSGKRAAQGEVFPLSSELERKASRTASACDLIFALTCFMLNRYDCASPHFASISFTHRTPCLIFCHAHPDSERCFEQHPALRALQ